MPAVQEGRRLHGLGADLNGLHDAATGLSSALLVAGVHHGHALPPVDGVTDLRDELEPDGRIDRVALVQAPGPEEHGHSPQGFSVTKASAAFWPLPEKLKPSTLTILSTSGWLRKNASACCMTASVRVCVAPGGSCTLAMR